MATIARVVAPGLPLGSVSFIEGLEKTLGRLLKPKKAGRKPKDVDK